MSPIPRARRGGPDAAHRAEGHAWAWRLVLAATAAGLLIGLVVSLLLPTTYRAEATIVLARAGEAPGQGASLEGAAEAARALLVSRTVAASAIQNLRLDLTAEDLLDRIDVATGARSSLLRVSVNAAEREEARRTAQEVAQVFTVLYNSRYGPAVTASVWEGARAGADPVSPRPVLNLGLGALLGAAVGVAIAALRRPAPRLGLRRLESLTARERALARRAAELSLRERALEAAASPAPAAPQAPAATRSAPNEASSAEPFVRPGRGAWTVADVERLVALHGPAFPERSAELRTYVESIGSVAEADGRLPAGVEALVEDVFADLLERAAAAEPTRKP